MTNIMTMFAVLLTLGVMAQAMHIHPRHSNILTAGENEVAEDVDYKTDDGNSNDSTNTHSEAHVPSHNAFFFKWNSPCEEGYHRDFLGICREVW